MTEDYKLIYKIMYHQEGYQEPPENYKLNNKFMNAPKVIGQPCPTCQTPFVQGVKGPYCKPCYITWKNQNKPAPTYVNPNVSAPSNQPVSNQSNDIRANVALKMVSEIIASGKIEVVEWEAWANSFYNFTPNKGGQAEKNEITTITDGGELQIEDIPPF